MHGEKRRNKGVRVLDEIEPSMYAANERAIPRPNTDRTSLARYKHHPGSDEPEIAGRQWRTDLSQAREQTGK
jgi:hypothetical protein